MDDTEKQRRVDDFFASVAEKHPQELFRLLDFFRAQWWIGTESQPLHMRFRKQKDPAVTPPGALLKAVGKGVGN